MLSLLPRNRPAPLLHLPSAAQAREALETAPLPHQELRYEPGSRTVWSRAQLAGGPARITDAFLDDFAAGQRLIVDLHAAQCRDGEPPLQFLVVASAVPGIYNLGGDIAYFADRIRHRDRASMQRYAQHCIDVLHDGHRAMDLPIVTISLVQGDALGGGFEGALQQDVLVAERSARLGLPEILFNLFPGMGAYSFLSRRLDGPRAERMITSGRLYSGAELHAMGVVDVLAEDGEGEHAVRGYIEENSRRANALAGIVRTRRRVDPLLKQELQDIIEIWVDTAMRLEDPDLRRMERLVAAQTKRLRTITG
jgi:DSF synthase